MENLYELGMQNATELLILAFLSVTFLQSGIDKLSDWKGNLSYINSVFEKTFLKKSAPLLLTVVTIGELIGGFLTLVGVFQIYFYDSKNLGLLGAVICAKVLLALLFGQRIAKDYAGAMTIVIYFMVTIFGVYILSK
ncbi:MAG: DoxX family membrane protein [Flavobacteriaceae bacterium]|nr:DoxX family membrane protein [Flavobacteriaceae bacterium]